MFSSSPAMDRKENPDAHDFEIELPEFKKKDVKVQTYEGRVVRVSAERKDDEEEDEEKGSWHCRVRRSNAKDDEIEASMRGGVLVVVVHKVDEAYVKDKKNESGRIEIEIPLL
ncbi:hypothetical protein F3Y22_tig00112293pilonHSYRG00198 [Hibiscus syriacus]|uniref:SHSP domain-containing protein n=2 Tax=Hibiscus syriacus TaxID=106335 RepID=A0A6A2X1E4_HIBSY|nr:hypothetical protein F3Y22_tig00112293pilonHSYRG00198 [Hibiscus syriacus]